MTLDSGSAARTASAGPLSVALMEARNHSLRWLAAMPIEPSALWLAARAGWWTEHWIVRNVQAQRGETCDPKLPRLASIDPALAARFEGAAGSAMDAPTPPVDSVRAYLAETLEQALDLLQRADQGDRALHFYRLALLHEDRVGEALAALAQASGVAEGPWAPMPDRTERDPLWLPAQRFELGSLPGGLVPANERWAHPVAVPEFEIDAQAVTWARFAEFSEDGGYDDPQWWTEAGWAWAQVSQRRAPRYVEQLGQGVVALSRGRLSRLQPNRPVVHLSRHEAQAWCRWAGRRLPTEVEWELAAATSSARGFVWGDVLEWVAGAAAGWPGYQSLPGDLDPVQPGAGVLRGSSWLAHPRLRHPKARRFVAPDADGAFCGFRSCAL